MNVNSASFVRSLAQIVVVPLFTKITLNSCVQTDLKTQCSILLNSLLTRQIDYFHRKRRKTLNCQTLGPIQLECQDDL